MMNILKTLPNVGLAAAFSRKGKGVDDFQNSFGQSSCPSFADGRLDVAQLKSVGSGKVAIGQVVVEKTDFPCLDTLCQVSIDDPALFFICLVCLVYVHAHKYNIKILFCQYKK